VGHDPADGQAQSAVAQGKCVPAPKHFHLRIVYIVWRERSFRCDRTSGLQHLFPTKEEEALQKCVLIFFERFCLFDRERQVVTEIARESTSGEERERQTPTEQGACFSLCLCLPHSLSIKYINKIFKKKNSLFSSRIL